MAGESDSPIWSRLTRLFKPNSGDPVEQAILAAREEGELEPEEGSMLLSILHLNDVRVQDIMTPRTDIECEEISQPPAAVVARIIESGHSRIPIYKETRDNIVGVAYAKDMLRAMCMPDMPDSGQEERTENIMRPPFFVPETKNVHELLQEFRTRKNHLAIAIDEYGGTSGLVTIEDVLEVIVGDIEDEHDAPRDEDVVQLENGSLCLTGRTWLEDLEKYGLHIESDEVDTIGGYITMILGHVPQAGEQAVIDDWIFTIDEADAKQIRQLNAHNAARESSSDEAGATEQ